METRLSFLRQHIRPISIGVFVATGVMIMSQQFEGGTGQHDQTEAVTPNVHESESPKDKKVVLPNDNESVSPLAANTSADASIRCWVVKAQNKIKCSTKWYYCYLPGWKSVPPKPPYCTTM